MSKPVPLPKGRGQNIQHRLCLDKAILKVLHEINTQLINITKFYTIPFIQHFLSPEGRGGKDLACPFPQKGRGKSISFYLPLPINVKRILAGSIMLIEPAKAHFQLPVFLNRNLCLFPSTFYILCSIFDICRIRFVFPARTERYGRAGCLLLLSSSSIYYLQPSA